MHSWLVKELAIITMCRLLAVTTHKQRLLDAVITFILWPCEEASRYTADKKTIMYYQYYIVQLVIECMTAGNF